ncbi:hypothetical protein LF1_00230 [Rubripirellula obstinata]|uniref:Uncharacterized protein n=2 Tax=Rubripirellula obstinata TaxID=406547 RepID=A0A5B1CAG8_9BACT|nr:hypothetical protein [Rubripirellula obstinata]KAA1257536.1 hypothetical protein LF1_00230 [Rubripirellula obstinata]
MTNADASKLPNFSGKVLSISTMDDESSHDMADPRFEMQADRLFIVGTSPDGSSESNWCAGAKLAVAWDRVTDYYIFDSTDHYASAIAISRRPDVGSGD